MQLSSYLHYNNVFYRSVQALVETNTDCVHWKGRHDRTPLHMACSNGSNGNIKTAHYLINKGANISAQ